MMSISDLTKLSTDELKLHCQSLSDADLIALALVVSEMNYGIATMHLLRGILRTLAARFQARVFGEVTA